MESFKNCLKHLTKRKQDIKKNTQISNSLSMRSFCLREGFRLIIFCLHIILIRLLFVGNIGDQNLSLRQKNSGSIKNVKKGAWNKSSEDVRKFPFGKFRDIFKVLN